MKKIILLIVASLTFLIAEDVEIKSAGTNYNNGVVIKNSVDSVLVDIDGPGVMNIRGIPTTGATLRLFEAFGNGFSYFVGSVHIIITANTNSVKDFVCFFKNNFLNVSIITLADKSLSILLSVF